MADNDPNNYLDSETDLILREYIIGLANQCITNGYKGKECRLATFLAHRIYTADPVDLRPRSLDEPPKQITATPMKDRV